MSRRPKAKGDSLGDRVWNRQTTPVEALDPWSQERFRKAAERWNRLQKAHRATVQSMWLGTMLTQFDHDDLAVLAAVGYLSVADCDLLARAETFGPPPLPGEPDGPPSEAPA